MYFPSWIPIFPPKLCPPPVSQILALFKTPNSNHYSPYAGYMNLPNQGFNSSLNADGAQLLISNSDCLPVLQSHLSNYLHDISAFAKPVHPLVSPVLIQVTMYSNKQEAWLHPNSLFFLQLLHQVIYQFLNIPQFIAIIIQVLLFSQQFHCE